MNLQIILDMQNDKFKTIDSTIVDNIKDSIKDDYMFCMETNDTGNFCVKGQEGWRIIPELESYVPKAKAVIEKAALASVTLISLIKDYDSIELMGAFLEDSVISNALMLQTFYPNKTIKVNLKNCFYKTKKGYTSSVYILKNCNIELF